MWKGAAAVFIVLSLLFAPQTGVAAVASGVGANPCAVVTQDMCVNAALVLNPCMAPSRIADVCEKVDTVAPLISIIVALAAVFGFVTSASARAFVSTGIGWLGELVRRRHLATVIVRC